MRWLLALIFLFCSLKDAAALRRANAQDYRDIADQISRKKSAEDDIIRENRALDDARGKKAEEIKTEIARLEKERKDPRARQAHHLGSHFRRYRTEKNSECDRTQARGS